MLLTKKVKVKWNATTKKYYQELGYKYTKTGDQLIVNVDDLMPHSGVIVKVKCDVCGLQKLITYSTYYQDIHNVDNNGKYLCPKCAKRHKHDLDRVEIAKSQFRRFIDFCQKYDYTPISTERDYINAKTKMKYICPNHGQKEITMDSIKRGGKCKNCSMQQYGLSISKSTQEVISIVESKNNNKLLNPNEYLNVKKNNLMIQCGSCGNVFTSSLASIMVGDGMCKQCATKHVADSLRTSQQDILAIAAKVGSSILNPQDYIDNNTYNLNATCPVCGNIFVTSLLRLQNYIPCCQNCRNTISLGELKIQRILQKYEIKYEQQKWFADCRDVKPLPFDFYLKDYNTCIQFDGQYHYEPIFGEQRLQKTKIHDQMKNYYCKNNGIKLIRIPYYNGNNMEQIILKNLGIVKKIQSGHYAKA